MPPLGQAFARTGSATVHPTGVLGRSSSTLHVLPIRSATPMTTTPRRDRVMQGIPTKRRYSTVVSLIAVVLAGLAGCTSTSSQTTSSASPQQQQHQQQS